LRLQGFATEGTEITEMINLIRLRCWLHNKIKIKAWRWWKRLCGTLNYNDPLFLKDIDIEVLSNGKMVSIPDNVRIYESLDGEYTAIVVNARGGMAEYMFSNAHSGIRKPTPPPPAGDPRRWKEPRPVSPPPPPRK